MPRLHTEHQPLGGGMEVSSHPILGWGDSCGFVALGRAPRPSRTSEATSMACSGRSSAPRHSGPPLLRRGPRTISVVQRVLGEAFGRSHLAAETLEEVPWQKLTGNRILWETRWHQRFSTACCDRAERGEPNACIWDGRWQSLIMMTRQAHRVSKLFVQPVISIRSDSEAVHG